MAYEQRDNSGSLFKNERREKDTHPNATGKAMIDGKLYWVNAWTKEGDNGRWQSLSFKPVEAAATHNPTKDVRSGLPSAADFDDDFTL